MHGGEPDDAERIGAVGTSDEPDKYALGERVWQGDGVVCHRGWVTVADIALEVLVWVTAADPATDDAWLEAAVRAAAVRHPGDAVVREGFIGHGPTGEAWDRPGVELRWLITNPVDHQPLADWIDARRPPAGDGVAPISWLVDTRGVTITPGDATDIPVVELGSEDPGPPPTRRGASRWLWVWAGLIGLAVGGLCGWLIADSGESESAGAHDCDPNAYAAEAAAFSESSGLALTWADHDGDCYHTSYEIHWIGSDYLVPDPDLTGQRPTADMQVRVLVNFYDDGTTIRGLDPGACDPQAVGAAATRFIEQTGLVVTWSDVDNDCMHDVWELNATGTDPNQPDSDSDGTIDSLDPKMGNGGLLVPLDEQLIFVTDVHGRNHIDPAAVEPTDPVRCVPDAWARAAGTSLIGSDVGSSWEDPDGDCLHSVFEEGVSGTDPALADTDGDGVDDGNDTDGGDGMIPPLDRQFDFVVLGVG